MCAFRDENNFLIAAWTLSDNNAAWSAITECCPDMISKHHGRFMLLTAFLVMLLVLWLLEPLIHALEKLLSPHMIVSYVRQTIHQSINTMDLSWSSLSARSHAIDWCSLLYLNLLPLVERLLRHLPFRSLHFQAVPRPHTAVFHLWSLVAILMTQHFFKGGNLIVVSTCVTLVRPKGPITEWNGRPT